MATMDLKQHVTLFKYDHRRGRPELPLEWQF